MKTITRSVEGAACEQSRMIVAERKTILASLVGEYMRELSVNESGFQTSCGSFLRALSSDRSRPGPSTSALGLLEAVALCPALP